jgi:3-hydroxyisobutyrate dehydrogenase
MTGGDEADLERCRPLLEAMGSHIVHVGAVGAGHAAKALNNMLSASGLVVAIEVLAVGARFGLDPAVLLDVLNNSSGKNNSTEKKIAQQVLSRAFGGGFSMRLMRKDLATAMDLAHQTGTPVPVSAACFQVWDAAMRRLQAEGDIDHTAVARYIEDQAGVTLGEQRDDANTR